MVRNQYVTTSLVAALLLAGALVVLWRSILHKDELPRSELAAGNQTRTEQLAKEDQWVTIPNLVPGQSVKEVRNLFGREHSVDSSAAAESRLYYEWQLKDYDLFVIADGFGKILEVTTVHKQTVLETPDGVLLGRDTIAEVLHKLGNRVVPGSEDIVTGEGLWVYHFDVYSLPGKAWQSEYGCSLSEGNPEDLKILEQEDPPTKTVFMNVPATSVTLKLPEEQRSTP
jgi:hypothetical protein